MAEGCGTPAFSPGYSRLLNFVPYEAQCGAARYLRFRMWMR